MSTEKQVCTFLRGPVRGRRGGIWIREYWERIWKSPRSGLAAWE